MIVNCKQETRKLSVLVMKTFVKIKIKNMMMKIPANKSESDAFWGKCIFNKKHDAGNEKTRNFLQSQDDFWRVGNMVHVPESLYY